MTRTPRRLVLCLAAAALALTATGCGGASTPPPASSSTSTPETATTPEKLERREQQQVTSATARDALPQRADLPKGWVVDESPVSRSTRTYDPPQCADLELRGSAAQKFKDDHLEVEERVAYSEWTEGVAARLVVTLQSYSEPFPVDVLDAAGARLGECATYEQTIDGDDRVWTTRALTTPTVGDRALGVRYTPQDDASGRLTDDLIVRSGHNLVIVKYLPSTPTYDDQLLEDYAQGVLDRLEETA